MSLSRRLSNNILQKFHDDYDIISGISGKIQERSFYGMISLSLSKIISNNDVIFTEMPINRNENNGRIDFILTYRRWIYAIEFKVGYANFYRNENNENVSRPWNGVVNQLKSIPRREFKNKIKNIFDCRDVSKRLLPRGIVFLPVVLFGHIITSDNNVDLENQFNSINEDDFLTRHNTIHKSYECKYSEYKRDFNYINYTRNRQKPRAIVGFSFYSGHNALCDIKF